MKRFQLLLISCLFAMTTFAQGYSEQQIEAVMDSAFTNPNYALRWADGAIAQNPKCSDAYFLKACVYFVQEDYLSTLEVLNKALGLVSKKSVIPKYDMLCLRGLIYERVEDYELALTDYTIAIETNPTEVDAYESRILLYKNLEQYDKAEADCRMLLNVKDSLAYKLELASVLTYQEKTDEALDILNKIIKYQPKQVLPYATRSWVNYVAGNGQAAISDYITFMALEGDYSLDHLVTYSAMDYTYTIGALSNLVSSDSENLTWLSARIRVNIAQEDYEAALTDLDVLETVADKSPFSLYQRAQCYQGIYEFSKQVDAITALIALMDTEDADLYTMRGVAYRNMGNTDAAFTDFDKALQIAPTSISALAERGWTKYMLNKDEAALKDFTTAITYAEPNAWLHIQRGSIYQSLGDSIKAKTDFEMAMQLDTISSTYAFALVHLGKKQQAINVMKAIVAENTEDAGEHYDLACLYSLANMKSESIIALKRAVELGYKGFHHMQFDRDLDNIREEQGYKELLNNITKSKVSKMLEGFTK